MQITVQKTSKVSLYFGFYFLSILFLTSCGGGGGGSDTTTPPPKVDDAVPDSFTFNAQTTTSLGTWVESNTITISGINVASPLSITNGEYRIGSGSFSTANSTITNGQTLVVRVMSANSLDQARSTTLTVGGVSSTFTVTTQSSSADTTPDNFTLVDFNTTSIDRWVESAAISITGITAPSPISITNGEYKIGSDDFTANASTINNNQSVTVRVRSSASLNTTTSANLTVGGVSDAFEVTTQSVIARTDNTNCVAPAQVTSGNSTIQLEEIFPNLPDSYNIIGMFQEPNDSSRWYITTKSGRVYWFDNNQSASTLTLFVDLSSQINAGGEGGLLGMAFEPTYSHNVGGRVYFSYTNKSSKSIIARITSDGTNALNISTRQELMSVTQPANNHNGGNIAFGPDGYLYIGFGDGGGGNDQYGNGQNTQTLLGAMLRIDVSGSGTSYAIPADNPFVNNNNVLDEIYAYGVRNPWRWSFDKQNGDLWVADVGQELYEEVDIVSAGDNLGWPIMEGAHCFQSSSCNMTGLTLPVAEYTHQNGDCSVTGGFVYRGQSVPALQGHFVYGDFCTGRMFSTVKSGSQSYTTKELLLSGMNISTFGQGNDGEIIVVNYGGSGSGAEFYRLKDTSGSGSSIAANLSDTGCFASTVNKTVANGVLPFDVTSKLWSDGEDKTRFLAIPNNTEIGLYTDGDFNFPDGTVLIKNFTKNNLYYETRLFMRHASGWAGYSYKWAADQSDAILVDGAQPEEVSFSGYTHTIPSRGQCFECHTGAANASLGPEASQLDFAISYASNTSGNQLDALSSAGYLINKPSEAQTSKMVSIDDTSASLNDRARSYLHANCSGCHRPGGIGLQLDLKIQTSFANTNTCDVAPASGDLGINNARIIAPGEAARSVLVARISSLNSQERMPPLATQLVDTEAVTVITDWINALSSCH